MRTAAYRSTYEVKLLRDVERGTAQLESFVSENGFLRKIIVTRRHIIDVFQNARSAPDKRATRGSIAGLDNQISDIARAVQKIIAKNKGAQEEIFSVQNLPDVCRGYEAEDKKTLVEFVRRELVIRTMIAMRAEYSLYYLNDEWMVPQSTLDEGLERFREAGTKNYRNWRGFHGRPSRERKRAGHRPGLSCAWA